MSCSCGCGRKVGLRDLRADGRARSARRLVGRMEALGFAGDHDEYRRAWLFEGVSWRNQYTRIVHGELTREQIRDEAAWRRWHSGARAAVRQARREPGRAAPAAVSAPVPAPAPRDAVRRAVPAKPAVVLADDHSDLERAAAEQLAPRVREVIGDRDGVTEGTMFGGVAWLVHGNMACGTIGDDLLVRIDVAECDRVIAETRARPIRRGARTMRGFVCVDSAAIADDAELARWVDAGAGYAAWLSPKPAPARRARR